MSVVIAATVDKNSKTYARELQALKQRAAALMEQHPDKQFVTGKREEGAKLHLTVMICKSGANKPSASDGNYIVAAPAYW